MYLDSEELAKLVSCVVPIKLKIENLGRFKQENWSNVTDNYKCKLTGPTGSSLTVNYSKGVGHNGLEPDIEEILYSCINSLHTSLNYDYNEFISEFGYEDTKEIKKLYKNILTEAKKFSNILDKDLNTAIENSDVNYLIDYFLDSIANFKDKKNINSQNLANKALDIAQIISLNAEYDDQDFADNATVKLISIACDQSNRKYVVDYVNKKLNDHNIYQYQIDKIHQTYFYKTISTLEEAVIINNEIKSTPSLTKKNTI